MSSSTDSYYAYIYEYNFTEEETNNLANGSIANIGNNINFTIYNPDYSQVSINSIPENCWETIVISEAQVCQGKLADGSAANHMPGDECIHSGSSLGPQEAVTIIVLTADCDFNGGSGPSGPSGPSTGNPWVNPEFNTGGGNTNEWDGKC